MILPLALLALAGPIRIHVDAALFPNAAHHLACLSERLPCTRASFEKFWHEELHWTAEDEAALTRWKAVVTAVAARQPAAQESPFLANFTAWYPEAVASNKLVAAALGSKSAADFRKRAAGLALDEELATLSASLEHFRVRLEPWWKVTGLPYAEARRRAVEAALKKLDAGGQASRVAAFYEAEPPARDFYLHLIPRSDMDSKDASASFARNHMVVELTEEMQGDGVVSIVLHEMTHALFELAPVARHRQLIREFAEAPDSSAQALYAIFNEGLATAIQLNELKRAGASDDDPYHHPFIPRIGRAEAPVVEAAMAAGTTAFQGFASRYLAAARKELGAEAESPRFVMLSGTVVDFEEPELTAAFRAEFPMLSAASFSDRDRYKELNISFVLTYGKLPAIVGNWPAVREMAEQHRGFAFTAPRNGKGRVYVVSGRDAATVKEVIGKLAAMRAGLVDGLAFALD